MIQARRTIEPSPRISYSFSKQSMSLVWKSVAHPSSPSGRTRRQMRVSYMPMASFHWRWVVVKWWHMSMRVAEGGGVGPPRLIARRFSGPLPSHVGLPFHVVERAGLEPASSG